MKENIKQTNCASTIMNNNKAQGQGGVISFVIGVVVLVIVVATVAIPIVNDSITTSNISGTDATILGVVSTLLAVFIIVMIANAMQIGINEECFFLIFSMFFSL